MTKNLDAYIKDLIGKIRDDRYSRQQLVTLLDNAVKHEGITDAQREDIRQEIEAQLRTRFPAVAKKFFGPKDAQARRLLQNAYDTVSASLDLSANTVGQGVKTGGEMLAGRAFIDVYISYKSPEGWHIGFGYFQTTPDADPMLNVNVYLRGASNPEGREHTQFPADRFDDALALYVENLSRVIP